MNGFLLSLAAFIVAIGVLITVHEFGHYWVARRMGVKVLRFSIGFGKPLWTRVAGADRTEYVLAAIPLGGYVKMLDEREGDVAPDELNRAFNRKPLYARFAVVAAGPVFNLVFAVAAYWVIFVTGVQGLVPIVGQVTPQSPAAMAQLHEKDRIVAVEGREVQTWSGANVAMIDAVLSGGEMALEVEDEQGQRRVLLISITDPMALMEDNRLLENLGIGIWRPTLPPVLGDVVVGGAAERAGLRSGDEVVSAGGTSITSWMAWVEFVRAHPAQEQPVEILRDGRMETIFLTPDAVEEAGMPVGKIGAGPQVPDNLYAKLRAEERYGPVEAVGVALGKTWDMSLLMLRMIGKMIIGEASVENISGPISIAQYAGQSAQFGLVSFLGFLAVVSISLGVLNLLPVPLLDGGHLLYYVIEAVKGSPVSEAAEIVGQKIGIGLLVALMVLAFYNDLSRLLF